MEVTATSDIVMTHIRTDACTKATAIQLRVDADVLPASSLKAKSH